MIPVHDLAIGVPGADGVVVALPVDDCVKVLLLPRVPRCSVVHVTP